MGAKGARRSMGTKAAQRKNFVLFAPQHYPKNPTLTLTPTPTLNLVLTLPLPLPLPLAPSLALALT